MSSENQVAEQPSDNNVTELNNTPPIQEQIANWKDSLPDDLKTEKALESIQDVPGLAKSYIHAQKMIGSDKIPVPNKYATDEDWQAVYNKLGRPETPDAYEFKFDDNSSIDENALKGFKEAAHKHGLLPKQAEGIMNFYNEMTQNYIQDLNSKSEQGRVTAEESLKKEWGNAYDNKLNQAKAIANKYLDKDFNNLTLSDGTRIGDHPNFIKAFASLANELGEDQLVQANGPQYMTPKELDKQIATLQQAGSAYWNKNHPGHAAAVQEVQDLLALKLNSK
jgi:hypothetical protein|tara:strand:- start:326 stop:1162 length:837 start_codon:yes stop_codon:yes gene_type:complete